MVCNRLEMETISSGEGKRVLTYDSESSSFEDYVRRQLLVTKITVSIVP